VQELLETCKIPLMILQLQQQHHCICLLHALHNDMLSGSCRKQQRYLLGCCCCCSAAAVAAAAAAAAAPAGDSRMKLMLNYYPDTADWHAMWTLVARCNKLPRITPNNTLQLAPGTTIGLPEFDVPVFLQEENNNATETAPGACGCTPNITLDAPASLLEFVTTTYPDLDALVAANMLVACNPGIHKSKGQLAAQQQLAGICPPKNEPGTTGLCSCGAYTTQPGDSYRKIMRSACPNCTEDASSSLLLLSCNVAKGVSKGQLPPGLTLQLPCYERLQDLQIKQRQAAGELAAQHAVFG
jgi:hypothetical protein